MIKSIFGDEMLKAVNIGYKTAEYNPNTYTLFTELAIRKLLKQDGIFSLIIPNTWLDGKYFSKMRDFISSLEVSRIVNLKNVAFDEIVETIILIGRKSSYKQSPELLNYRDDSFRTIR